MPISLRSKLALAFTVASLCLLGMVYALTQRGFDRDFSEFVGKQQLRNASEVEQRLGDGKRLEKMAQQLDLNDEQKSQVAQIMKAQGAKRKAMMEAHKAQRDAMQADMRSQLSGVLTPEQMQKLDNMREERDELREEKMEKWKEKREKHKERY